MGYGHATSIVLGKVPGLRLAAVADTSSVLLERATSLDPSIAGFADVEEMIRSGKIDALLIATPHFSHTTIGIQALEAGLHVLVEKPLSVTKADAERLVAAHTRTDRVFAIMFNQRTDPRYAKLRDLVHKGELGEIQRVQWTITHWFRPHAYYASGGWRATWAGEGGGVIMNQCPHQLDLLCWIFGLPRKLRSFCRYGRYHEIEVEDDVTAYMEFESGASGVLIASTGEAPGSNRLEVACERGRVVVEGTGPIRWTRTSTPVSQFSRSTPSMFGVPETWEVEIPVEGEGEQHLGILRDFASACLKGHAPIAPAIDGLRQIELANAILFSSDTEQTLEFPLDAAAYQRWLEDKINASVGNANSGASTSSLSR